MCLSYTITTFIAKVSFSHDNNYVPKV